MLRARRFGKPWEEMDARSQLLRRLQDVCDRLLHPDLALAGAAASDLCCILYTIASLPTGPHVYYARNDEVAKYQAMDKDLTWMNNWISRCGCFCTCTSTSPLALHRCSCETNTNTLEYRLVELLRRCTSSQGQSTLSLGHKRKRDATRQSLIAKGGFRCDEALTDALRALSMHARAPGLVPFPIHNFERNGPISRTQLAQLLFDLLRAEKSLPSDEAWANAAICLMHTFSDVRPVISVWTDHPRSVASLLGWPPRWQTTVERVVDPLGGDEVRRVRFCAVDEGDDHPLSVPDERMITRLLHVARGWPRLGWLHREAADAALGLLWILQNAGPWQARNLICRDERLLGRIMRDGRRQACVGSGLGDPVQMESEWHQDDEESDEEFQQRLAAIPPMLPSELGQSVYTPPTSAADEDDSDDEKEAEGLAWEDHPPLLVAGDPSYGEECPICLEDLTEPKQIHLKGRAKSLHCRCVGKRTLYHEVCLRTHLLRSNACPRCRAAPATTAWAFQIPYHASQTQVVRGPSGP